MNKETMQNIALGVAALGLAYAMYKVFAKGGSKSSGKAPVVPSENGSLSWMNGTPDYTSYAPYNSNTLAGQLGINKLLQGTLNDLNTLGFM